MKVVLGHRALFKDVFLAITTSSYELVTFLDLVCPTSRACLQVGARLWVRGGRGGVPLGCRAVVVGEREQLDMPPLFVAIQIMSCSA